MTSRLLACLLLTACGESSSKINGTALAERRATTRTLAAKLLTSSNHAFLGREDLIIRDERLLSPLLDRIMSNVESWIDGDEARLRFFLESQVNGARDELITSDDGIKALNSLAQAAFADPKIERHEGKTPGRKASELEKQAAKVAGTLLSGRPAEARDLPAVQWVEVHADFGLIPAPLEKNPRNKQSVSLLRHRQDAAKDWLNDQHPVRPRLEVIARLARDLMHQHPDAKRQVLRMMVLRTSGEPIKWEFIIEPSANKEFNLSGTATAPGFHDDFGSHLLKP
ncbi:MAG: hypothetical protein JNJ83_16720 [Verrucomicrobiaceae bacterium]|nr:hypothetical protein [Verrucomicrobiaceae bacterium]